MSGCPPRPVARAVSGAHVRAPCVRLPAVSGRSPGAVGRVWGGCTGVATTPGHCWPVARARNFGPNESWACAPRKEFMLVQKIRGPCVRCRGAPGANFANAKRVCVSEAYSRQRCRSGHESGLQRAVIRACGAASAAQVPPYIQKQPRPPKAAPPPKFFCSPSLSVTIPRRKYLIPHT